LRIIRHGGVDAVVAVEKYDQGKLIPVSDIFSILAFDYRRGHAVQLRSFGDAPTEASITKKKSIFTTLETRIVIFFLNSKTCKTDELKNSTKRKDRCIRLSFPRGSFEAAGNIFS